MWAMRGEGREMHDLEVKKGGTEGELFRVTVRETKEYNSKRRDPVCPAKGGFLV